MQVSMHMVRAVVSAVEKQGASRTSFLTRSGIAASDLEAHDGWLPVATFRHILEAAHAITDDPALGLHWGEQASSLMFQLLAHLVEHAATLGEAIDAIVRYTGLLAQSYEPRLVRVGERMALRFPWLCGDSSAVRVMADLALSGLVRLLQQYVPDALHAASICFAYPTPANVAEYQRAFAGRAAFAQPITELEFPRAWLVRTQLHANPALQRWLEARAEQQLALQHDSRFSTRVQQLLAATEARVLPSLAAAARALGVSPRTMTRRLRSERVTYAGLVAARRRSAAEQLLEQNALSIQEIAEAMGFSDAPAFHKAFKRWTGVTPLRYAAKAARG
jgi:AraC-like DNA-binding protein